MTFDVYSADNLKVDGSVTFKVLAPTTDFAALKLRFKSGLKDLENGKPFSPPVVIDHGPTTTVTPTPVVTATPTPMPVPTLAPSEAQVEASATEDTVGELKGVVKFKIPAGALNADSTIKAAILRNSQYFLPSRFHSLTYRVTGQRNIRISDRTLMSNQRCAFFIV